MGKSGVSNEGPSIKYVCTWGRGVKPSIYFHCILHAKRGEVVRGSK